MEEEEEEKGRKQEEERERQTERGAGPGRAANRKERTNRRGQNVAGSIGDSGGLRRTYQHSPFLNSSRAAPDDWCIPLSIAASLLFSSS